MIREWYNVENWRTKGKLADYRFPNKRIKRGYKPTLDYRIENDAFFYQPCVGHYDRCYDYKRPRKRP